MAVNKKGFKPSVSAERQFAKALKQVAQISGHIVDTHIDGHQIRDQKQMERSLKEYSKRIGPWAERQAAKMLEKVSQSNLTAAKGAMTKNAKALAKNLRLNLAESEVNRVAQALMREQVELIQSIPLRAGIRAQTLAQEAFFNGDRASQIAEELQKTTDVSESDAIRIARTEVARSHASINQARSTAVGSTQYRWRNSGDSAVRESHKYYQGHRMEGHVFDWDDPPTLDDGTKGHPGTFPNCRCYAESIFPEENEH